MKLTREEAAQRFINDGSATLDHKLTAYGNFKKWCADHDIEIIQTVYRIETLEFVDTPEEKASYENSNGNELGRLRLRCSKKLGRKWIN